MDRNYCKKTGCRNWLHKKNNKMFYCLYYSEEVCNLKKCNYWEEKAKEKPAVKKR